MEEVLSVYIDEAQQRLRDMEHGLMRLEAGDRNPDTVNEIFRCAHTIKGGAGVVELVSVERFTHGVENVLERLRNGEIAASTALASLLLSCCDHIAALLAAAGGSGTSAQGELEARGAELTKALHRFLDAPAPIATSATQDAEPEPCGQESDYECWHISVRFGESCFRSGIDPCAILQFLATLGDIEHVTTIADGIPVVETMDAQACYLGFEIALRSAAEKASIEHAFEFVRDDCELHILPPRSRVADYLQLIADLPEEPMRIGEILVKCGALTREELDEGLARQQTAGGDAPGARIGEILVSEHVVQPQIVEAAAAKQKQVIAKKADEARLIRVHADKLDRLIDLVGELVIAGASANLLARKSRQIELVESTSVLSRLVEDIRESALRLRMVQIGETFSRFHRVIRDGAKELGKDIALDIRGAETELDKSVVEKIGDPLMHLVRNAMDHGLEPAAERSAAGKPATGCVGLTAYHDSGSVVIEVTDDGRGLPVDKIRAKAIDKGLVTAGQALTQQDVANLIFEPGFSTAEQVTNLSGRGVGMDVVRRNIEALRGTVEVASEEGRGCRFTIRLPLTLAIIDGFLVGVDRAEFVLPLETVVECTEMPRGANGRNYLDLRGEALPIVRLREMFEIGSPEPARANVVVVRSGGRKFGVVVDVLHGEFQTVIKPLGELFKHLRGISGSTILGSGEVALILDVGTLAAIATDAEKRRLDRAAAHTEKA